MGRVVADLVINVLLCAQLSPRIININVFLWLYSTITALSNLYSVIILCGQTHFYSNTYQTNYILIPAKHCINILISCYEKDVKQFVLLNYKIALQLRSIQNFETLF